jgi:hypothetical protein
LFALPTNPTLIDIFDRRGDYSRNSKLLSEWAESRAAIYLDLGIQDVTNSDIYFSDMRHLSGVGAKEFSKKLANKIAAKIGLNQNIKKLSTNELIQKIELKSSK